MRSGIEMDSKIASEGTRRRIRRRSEVEDMRTIRVRIVGNADFDGVFVRDLGFRSRRPTRKEFKARLRDMLARTGEVGANWGPWEKEVES